MFVYKLMQQWRKRTYKEALSSCCSTTALRQALDWVFSSATLKTMVLRNSSEIEDDPMKVLVVTRHSALLHLFWAPHFLHTFLGGLPVLHVILALICVTYQFANNVKTYVIELIQTWYIFFSWLWRHKCRGFSLAQCFLWWWGKPAENKEHSAVIGSVFCHSWGHNVTSKSKGTPRKF